MITFETEHFPATQETLVFINIDYVSRALFLAFDNKEAAEKAAAFFNRLASKDATDQLYTGSCGT